MGHGDGYCAVQVQMTGDGVRLGGKFGVEDDDAVPIGFGWRAGAGVASGDLGLEEISLSRFCGLDESRFVSPCPFAFCTIPTAG